MVMIYLSTANSGPPLQQRLTHRHTQAKSQPYIHGPSTAKASPIKLSWIVHCLQSSHRLSSIISGGFSTVCLHVAESWYSHTTTYNIYIYICTVDCVAHNVGSPTNLQAFLNIQIYPLPLLFKKGVISI